MSIGEAMTLIVVVFGFPLCLGIAPILLAHWIGNFIRRLDR
jgi:hypothetical protein